MKSAGIYRIYINDKSYIGWSKNIEKKIKNEYKNIKMYLKNKTNARIQNSLLWLLNLKTLPGETESNFKIALYIIEKNLNLEDLNWEILQLNSSDNMMDILKEEQFFINKYNSYLNGFNNFNVFNERLENIVKNSLNPLKTKENYKNIFKQQENNKNNIIKKIFEKTDNNFSPWMYYNLKNINRELKHHYVWLDYCDLIIKKYEKWLKQNNKR